MIRSTRFMNMASIVSLLLGISADVANAQTYSIAQNYTGNSFFSGWDFYSGVDLNTTGNVFYVGEDVATSQQLAYVNGAGNVVLKVDNITNGAGNDTFGRNSIRISTKGTFYLGSLVIMDAVHMPFGCSVWPAYWSQGPVWPDNGEIDIVEQVNLATQNQHALHTLQGCTHPDAASSTSLETGNLLTTDCFNQTNFNSGCIVQDPTNSYGQGFASNGGGVYALAWDDQGIRIWFFERNNVPSDMSGDSPNPSGWGTPTAFYPTSTCNTKQFFTPQNLIFNIDICGQFAIDAFNSTCSGNCLDLVADPTNYNDAYFELKYVRVFSNGSSPGTTTLSDNSSSSSTSGSGSSQTGGSGSGSGGSSDNNGASRRQVQPILTIMAAVVLPAAIAAIAIF